MPSNRPKILFCMHMPPPVHGAAMVGHQIRESKLINDEFDCAYMNVSTSATLGDVGHFSLAKIRRTIAFYRQVLSEVSELQPDLVYFTPSTAGWALYRDVITIRLLRLKGQNIVLHFHNKTTDAYLHKWYNKRVWKHLFQGVSAIFLGETLAKQFDDYTPLCKHVFVCPNGMTNMVGEMQHEQLQAEQPYTFLFLSNMIESKGVYVLLEACAILKQKGYSFRCDFVGQWFDVTKEAFDAKCAQLDLADCVQAHEAKFGTDKNAYMQQADALVFPTYYPSECFPLVILEAMQCALPVISTNEGAIPEIIYDGKDGRIVKRQDAVDLADKMEWLIIHPAESKQMGKIGYAKYSQNYTLDHFEQRMLNILTECIQIKK